MQGQETRGTRQNRGPYWLAEQGSNIGWFRKVPRQFHQISVQIGNPVEQAPGMIWGSPA